MVGGGSGGHITPLLAVAHRLRAEHPQAKIFYVLDKGNRRFANLPRKSKDLDGVYEVRAGKFRRYHGDSALSRLLDVPTNLKNIRDLFYVAAGFLQSLRLLRRLRPEVVFIKGSSVGVPIGKACRVLRIPYFTHDSDSVASLTNRLIAKHAVYHAVGLPLSFYSRSDTDKSMRYTGIPLSDAYKPVDVKLQQQYRRQVGLPEDGLVITVTGGSLGAVRLNQAFAGVAGSLLDNFSKLHILHQSGTQESQYQSLSEGLRKRIIEVDFTDELYAFTGAADVVVTRAGATTIAELAVQAKACILVPNPQLTGGQQTKNAEYLAKHDAVVVVSEAEAADKATFEQLISELLRSTDQRKALARQIAKLAKPDAAAALTAIIEEIAQSPK